MDVEFTECTIASVAELAAIPISFCVASVYDVHPKLDADEFTLTERSIEPRYVRDYDAIPGEGPNRWAERFDISKWAFIRAQSGPRLIGGAVIAFDTPDVTMLEGRRDLAVLWDIRVVPEHRGKGIGSGLLRKAEEWAISRRCQHLRVETQNINVLACRFYQRQSFRLISVNRFAYPTFPDEIQLLWSKNLSYA